MDHHRRTSFDEECRKIQCEADLANASERSLRGVVREDMYLGKTENEQIMVKGQQWTRTDSKLMDDLLSNSVGSKASADHKFGDRKIISEQKGTRIEPRPFSYALQVLHTDKDLVIEILPEPDCLLEKCIKNSCTAKEISSSRGSNAKRKTFSVGEIKKFLKHTFGGTRKEANQFSMCSQNRTILGDDCVYRGVETRNTSSSSTSVKAKGKLGKKRGVKIEREPDISARKKIDFSSGRFSMRYEVDAVLEANRLISARLIGSNADFSPVSPRRDWSASGQMGFSSYRTNTEVTSCNDGYKESDEEAQDTMASATRNTNSNDEPKIIGTNSVRLNNTGQRFIKLELHEEDGSDVMHYYTLSQDSDETFTNTVDDVPSESTPTSICRLPESSKDQEEHKSPVSVLDPFFEEDANSPSSNTFQTARDPLKPRRLRLEECSFESDEQDYVLRYVHLVFQASSLNWDQLSELRPLSDDDELLLLHPSLFEQVEFRLPTSRVDTRLVFDRMNEVLMDLQQSYFLSPHCSSARRICCVPLEQVVVDEIMREADLDLLGGTRTTTLDQLVAKDMADSRLWLHLWPETEHIMIHISDQILEESILDVILQFYS